ncbi:3-phosphoshikimate 1-carboxyvinyltransferase [Pontibacter silvestris]|uniref:3-phosphoshikimate 1-carboxyvinyltransferase n=1 Tax=Pontibacter silvestris TaxID=2305183 RepID=A0ABW4WRT5_9BACT|nr:3-phosphoshikimate 1-carboxyvinyltransferase [Pontibacter silvestris]MCC9138126.1 3-phosphoshikimate 1-carboxyvinyltransferase [Pontibacter silvestris]
MISFKALASLSLTHPTGILKESINLPASKSEANRALIIAALSGEGAELHNLSEANDTQLLQRLLKSNEETINAEDAGTVMRFLTGYYAVTGQEKILTGTARMCQRPIKVLVDALRELGANIEYLGEEGYPPMKIGGFKGNGNNKLKVRSDISSQYISSLLMVGPLLPDGLVLELEGKIGSRPYIEMTLSLMRHFGVNADFTGNTITVPHQQYKSASYSIEPDWSAASYWYSMVALAHEAEIDLPGLREQSFQGDSAIAGIMKHLGVYTQFTEQGVRLSKRKHEHHFSFDFSDCPDLAQTIVALCAAMGVTLEMTGVESLRIKETDRIQALQIEILSLGCSLQEVTDGVFRLELGLIENDSFSFRTYEDHRMAMAFAPLALLRPTIIQEPRVVRKSYPRYWEDLQKVGFEVTESEE